MLATYGNYEIMIDHLRQKFVIIPYSEILLSSSPITCWAQRRTVFMQSQSWHHRCWASKRGTVPFSRRLSRHHLDFLGGKHGTAWLALRPLGRTLGMPKRQSRHRLDFLFLPLRRWQLLKRSLRNWHGFGVLQAVVTTAKAPSQKASCDAALSSCSLHVEQNSARCS